MEYLARVRDGSEVVRLLKDTGPPVIACEVDSHENNPMYYSLYSQKSQILIAKCRNNKVFNQ